MLKVVLAPLQIDAELGCEVIVGFTQALVSNNLKLSIAHSSVAVLLEYTLIFKFKIVPVVGIVFENSENTLVNNTPSPKLSPFVSSLNCLLEILSA